MGCTFWDQRPKLQVNLTLCALQCFCYVCDVEAEKCQLWGSGWPSLFGCACNDVQQCSAFTTDLRLALLKQRNADYDPHLALPPRPQQQGSLQCARRPQSLQGHALSCPAASCICLPSFTCSQGCWAFQEAYRSFQWAESSVQISCQAFGNPCCGCEQYQAWV